MNVDHDAFVRLMQTIADSWSAGNTDRALACFADDAVYRSRRTSNGTRVARSSTTSSEGRTRPPMRMEWHHLVVDGDVGVGEYTYRGTRQYHGLVIVQLRNGVIARWREYQVESSQGWEAFVGQSRFD